MNNTLASLYTIPIIWYFLITLISFFKDKNESRINAFSRIAIIIFISMIAYFILITSLKMFMEITAMLAIVYFCVLVFKKITKFEIEMSVEYLSLVLKPFLIMILSAMLGMLTMILMATSVLPNSRKNIN